jgi:hypothetical protein
MPAARTPSHVRSVLAVLYSLLTTALLLYHPAESGMVGAPGFEPGTSSPPC